MIETGIAREEGVGKLEKYSAHGKVISIESLAKLNPSSSKKVRNIFVNSILNRKSLVVLGSKDYKFSKVTLGSRVV